MNRSIGLFVGAPTTVVLLAGLMLVLSACGSDHPAALPDPLFVGTWRFVGLEDEKGVRVYERLEERTGGADFDIQASGLLWIRRAAYVGGDWPTMFDCEGTWYEEPGGVVVFIYLFRDVVTSDRLTVLSVDALEMRCLLSTTK